VTARAIADPAVIRIVVEQSLIDVSSGRVNAVKGPESRIFVIGHIVDQAENLDLIGRLICGAEAWLRERAAEPSALFSSNSRATRTVLAVRAWRYWSDIPEQCDSSS
jgi:hypothetical protein